MFASARRVDQKPDDSNVSRRKQRNSNQELARGKGYLLSLKKRVNEARCRLLEESVKVRDIKPRRERRSLALAA